MRRFSTFLLFTAVLPSAALSTRALADGCYGNSPVWNTVKVHKLIPVSGLPGDITERRADEIQIQTCTEFIRSFHTSVYLVDTVTLQKPVCRELPSGRTCEVTADCMGYIGCLESR